MLTGGVRIDTIRQSRSLYVFPLPVLPARVTIASRSGVPRESLASPAIIARSAWQCGASCYPRGNRS